MFRFERAKLSSDIEAAVMGDDPIADLNRELGVIGFNRCVGHGPASGVGLAG